jgi:tetratricopeptide (TPR) repeat protein
MKANGGIGIDFGTTACRAGVYEGGKFRDMSPDMSVPVKAAAIAIHPPRTIPKGGDPSTPLYEHGWLRIETVKANLGTGKRLRDVKGYLPETFEDMARDILCSLRARLGKHLGAGISRAAVCVPACYGMNQRAALRAAARLAGFDEVALIDESVAAALFHYRGRADSTCVLAYCLGRSTFASSVLSLEGGDVRALSHEGTTRIGGQEFDTLLAQEVIRRTLQADGIDILKDPTAIRALLASAERARIALNTHAETIIEIGPVRDLTRRTLGGRMTVSRSLFEELAGSIVGETVALAQKAVQGAGLASNQIGEILLVGEATRTSIVKRQLATAFGCSCVHAAPHSVAFGAALYAASLWNCFGQMAELHSTPDGLDEGPGAPRNQAVEISGDGAEGNLSSDTSSGSTDALEAAYRTFRRALAGRDPEIGASAYEELSNRSREDLSYLFSRRSSELRQDGKNDEALDSLERGLKYWPTNTHIRRLLAAAYAEKAWRLAAQHRIHQVEELLRRSLDLDPANPIAIRLKEELSRALGRGKRLRSKRGKR